MNVADEEGRRPADDDAVADRIRWRLAPADRSQPAGRVVALVLGDLLDRFRSHEDGVRAATDPEELHQMRVALRRGRSVLTAGERVLPTEEAELLDALMSEFASLTSPVRDLDVAMDDLDELIEGLGPAAGAGADALRAGLEARRRAANAELVAALDGDLHRVLVRRWHAMGAVYRVGGSEPGPDSLRGTGDVVDDLLVDGARRLRRRGRRALESSELAEWHRLRKELKRFRYLLAEVEPLYPPKSLRKVLGHLGRLQDELGVLQDHAVQIELFASAGRETGGDAALTAGAVLGRLEVSAADIRSRCVRAWERYEDTRPVRRVRSAVAEADDAR